MKFKSYITGTVFLIFFLFCGGQQLNASKLEKGFAALTIHDYFKSKKIFESILAGKADAYSAYGLSVIYYRNDNPYFNLDSAAKYVNLSFNLYRLNPKAKTISDFVIDSLSVLALMDSVSGKEIVLVKRVNTIAAYNKFLLSNYGGNKKILQEAVYLRDELEFNRLLDINKSDSTAYFLVTHPQSEFFMEAALLKDRQVFDEYTVSMLAESYLSFLKQHPKNAMVNTALEKLFAIYKQNNDVKGLAEFVKDFPGATQTLDAWKLLFSLSVKSYSDAELTRFLETYPEFPLKNSILKELELNKLTLFPYQKEDLIGFVSDDGNIMISPEYDEVGDFYEGLSVVNKNDTVFFINKENTNPFNVTYSNAYGFHNGIAPVKRNNKWHFINRQGQTVSRSYEEIGELTGSAYVVKLNNKYGALNNFGQPLLEPKFEKLGDFANGFAYYIENGRYGFVSLTGSIHKADFEWISGFDSAHLAVVKNGQKYGLINSMGEKIVPEQYDQVVRAPGGIYIVVLNNQYGFFSPEGCFLSAIAFDYSVARQPEYYTNGTLFKLQKKSEQSIITANGSALVPFGAYEDVNFPASGLMKAAMEIKKEIKYGYVSTRPNATIPFKYSLATDFEDSTALVRFKNRSVLINTAGVELYSTDFSVDRLSAHYFIVNDDVRQIIDKRGIVMFTDVVNTQKPKPGLLIVTLYSGEIKLLYD